MSSPVPAWHFVGDALRDGSPVPPDGEWLCLPRDGRVPVLCSYGLHASRRLVDALRYAPGPTICRVELRDVVEGEDDKLTAWDRRILWRVDGEELLRRFARRCAMDVIDLWDAPDVVREYLTTGREELRVAAQEAMWEAARAAAWAAQGAGWAAAQAAAWAAQEAVQEAVQEAAWEAAWEAAQAAAWAAQEAAWDAAWAAARTRQNRRLASMVVAAHRRQQS